MNPIAGAFAVHGFVVVYSKTMRGSTLRILRFLCKGKIGGPWNPYEEEDAEVSFFRWKNSFCKTVVLCFVSVLPMAGLGDSFPTFEKREGAVKLVVDLGVFLVFVLQLCRKKPLGWCQSTGELMMCASRWVGE